MWNELIRYFSPDAVKLALTLFVSFLVGIEREQHKQRAPAGRLGGIRTLPLIALAGYAMALLGGDGNALIGVGFAVVGGFMLVSYRHQLVAGEAGITTELSGLLTYLVGALIERDHVWLGATLVVLSVLLLELKVALEGLTARVSSDEVFAFAKFLLLTIVILPIVPNHDFGSFHLNPFKTWVVVVAVSSVSYGSYLLQRGTRGRGGVALAALLGGAYSSTITTVALSKQSVADARPHRYAGAILLASGMMYLRLAALLALFNRALLAALWLPFALLAVAALLGGWLWSRRSDAGEPTPAGRPPTRNPLELRSAFLFALLFVGMVVATHFAVARLGKGGVFGLAALMGFSDVDPFILGIAQTTTSAATGLHVAGGGVLIAAASNNVAKGLYAFIFGERRAGRMALLLLLGLAACGLLPLLWV